MESTPQTIFPIFALMTTYPETENQNPDSKIGTKEGNDWVMCLWKESDSKEDFCKLPCSQFSDFIDHLKKEHNVKLKSNKDYCL